MWRVDPPLPQLPLTSYPPVLQFVASRPTSPILPRPTALRPVDKDHDLSAGANGAAKGTDAAASGVPTVVSILEEKANDM